MRKKALGFDSALALLKGGATMVHCPVLKTTINGLTVIHPNLHCLIPYCDRKKQKNGDVFYTFKEVAP